MRPPAYRWLLLLGPFLVALPGRALLGQDRANLDVAVFAADPAQPLAGAQVILPQLGLGGATDQRGFLRLAGLPEGRWMVEVHFLGYEPFSRPVELQADHRARIVAQLDLSAIGLPAVEVAAESNLQRRGFYERRRAGGGTYLNRNDIDKMRPRFMSDVLRRVGGIHVGSESRGFPAARMRGQQTIVGGCPIQYIVDGVVTSAYNINEMRPEDVDGVEIYRGAATIPAMFKRGSSMCGVIVLWTRLQ